MYEKLASNETGGTFATVTRAFSPISGSKPEPLPLVG